MVLFGSKKKIWFGLANLIGMVGRTNILAYRWFGWAYKRSFGLVLLVNKEINLVR